MSDFKKEAEDVITHPHLERRAMKDDFAAPYTLKPLSKEKLDELRRRLEALPHRIAQSILITPGPVFHSTTKPKQKDESKPIDIWSVEL